MAVAPFGTADGQDVFEVALGLGSGMQARVVTWGSVLRDLVVPTPSGRQRVVLGLERLEDYLAHSPYLGAVVGRYANRIGDACFRLDGRSHRLDANEGRNHLHGGRLGFARRVWSLVDHGPTSATLALVSRDGDMGYPGRLTATCSYALHEPATLSVTLEAVSDAPTPVNLTCHGYYNLDGSPDILGHELTILGDFITPTDPDLIPTGEVRAVAGTPFDFRTARCLGGAVTGTVYDINYVLHGDGALAHAATLASPLSGVVMELWTTEPGLQLYDSHALDLPVPGLGGARYGRHGAVVLEPQRFPDGPNRPHFPSCLLRPGKVSRQRSEFRFSVRG